MKNRALIPTILIAFLIFAHPVPAYAGGIPQVARGVGKTLGAVFQIPIAIVEDSSHILFPFGIVTGTVRGTVMTVANTLSGVMDIAVGAAPYAKYALLFM